MRTAIISFSFQVTQAVGKTSSKNNNIRWHIIKRSNLTDYFMKRRKQTDWVAVVVILDEWSHVRCAKLDTSQMTTESGI